MTSVKSESDETLANSNEKTTDQSPVRESDERDYGNGDNNRASPRSVNIDRAKAISEKATNQVKNVQ